MAQYTASGIGTQDIFLCDVKPQKGNEFFASLFCNFTGTAVGTVKYMLSDNNGVTLYDIIRPDGSITTITSTCMINIELGQANTPPLKLYARLTGVTNGATFTVNDMK